MTALRYWLVIAVVIAIELTLCWLVGRMGGR